MQAREQAYRGVPHDRVAWLGTAPVPALPYYDPSYFELERQAVFRRSWLPIGHECELPDKGSFIRREVEVVGASVLIVRGRDDRLRAFYNVCTHRGTELVAAESGRQATFSCPYHLWTFGIDGALISAPDFDQFHVTKAECALPPIALDVCAGLIFISFAENPEPLREWLGELAERLEALPVARATTFSEYVYEIDANWKLAFDNFQENYHLRFIHPRSSAGGTGDGNPFGYPEDYGFHGKHRTQTIWSNPSPPDPPPTLAFAYGQGFAALGRKQVSVAQGAKDYLILFPNFFMLGSPVQNFSQTVFPISPTRSRSVIRIYWVGDDDSASERFAREYFMAALRDVHCEDRGVIEAGQKGLSSGALKHIHFQTQEVLCRHFFKEIDAMVQDYRTEKLSAVPAQ